MFSQVHSAAVLGIDAYIVKVESHLESKTPKFYTVGMLEGAVRESIFRVMAAVKNSGMRFPLKRMTINLAPASIKKEGAAYDLPIAIGILAANGNIKRTLLDDFVILGELSLDGSLRPVKGVLPIATEVVKAGKKGIVLRCPIQYCQHRLDRRYLELRYLGHGVKRRIGQRIGRGFLPVKGHKGQAWRGLIGNLGRSLDFSAFRGNADEVAVDYA